MRCCLGWASAAMCLSACATAPSRWWRWPRASPARRWGWSGPARVRRRPPTPIPASWVGGWPPWTINGRTFPDTEPLPVGQGERVRLVFGNQSMMFHPMHLHGHSFQVRGPGGPGPRKDTVIVRPMQQLAVDVAADNPGQWMVHCHNLYHQEAGMMTTLSYVH